MAGKKSVAGTHGAAGVSSDAEEPSESPRSGSCGRSAGHAEFCSLPAPPSSEGRACVLLPPCCTAPGRPVPPEQLLSLQADLPSPPRLGCDAAHPEGADCEVPWQAAPRKWDIETIKYKEVVHRKAQGLVWEGLDYQPGNGNSFVVVGSQCTLLSEK